MNVARWHFDALGQKVVKALKRNDFDAIYFSSEGKAANHLSGSSIKVQQWPSAGLSRWENSISLKEFERKVQIS